MATTGDDYAGRADRDGIGDTPYEQYAYADRIWMDVPPARFSLAPPMLEVLIFSNAWHRSSPSCCCATSNRR